MVKIKKYHKKVLLKVYIINLYYINYIYIKLKLSSIFKDKKGKMKNKQEHIIQGIITFKSFLSPIKGKKEKSTK